jgi:CBS domain-containing protein
MQPAEPVQTPQDADPISSPERRSGNRRVRDVMRRDFITIATGESLLEALHLMRLARLRHLTVESGGLLAGILSYRDLQDELLTRSGPGPADGPVSPFSQILVADRMAISPYSIDPEATLGEAAARFERLRIGCLPVAAPSAEGPRLVGVLTEMDLVRAVFAG